MSCFHWRTSHVAILVTCMTFISVRTAWSVWDEETNAVEARISKNAKYLTSDAMEGRGVGTKGLEAAAERIKQEFQELGLKIDSYNGTPYQTFDYVTGARLGESNSLKFEGPEVDGKPGETIELELTKDFSPLAVGKAGQFRLPIVFAGYGISGRNEKYDDFADVDVKGKAVIILRHEPQQNDPKSVFNGTADSAHATFQSKINAAKEHGAEAIIFCTDGEEIRRFVEMMKKNWEEAIDALAKANDDFKKIENPTREQLDAHRVNVDKLAQEIRNRGEMIAQQYDPVFDFRRAGTESNGTMPVMFVRREAINKLLAAAGKPLTELEEAIDKGPTPQSFELTGWRALGQSDVVTEGSPIKNVIGILEGEGPNADETIVIGAHYDHVGWGEVGSRAPGEKAIHNGADDNGSGTTTLLEVARALATRKEKFPRRIVFIAFTAEERGLIGSQHYISNPLYPLDKTVAMLNMDMVGRLKDNKLIIYGVDTAKEFIPWLEKINEQTGFELLKKNGGIGPSDHAPFYQSNIPVLHFFTGLHSDYHCPTDDAEKLDVAGMRRVSEMVTELAATIAKNPEKPTFQQSTVGGITPDWHDRAYLGIGPGAAEVPGVGIGSVAAGGPAEKGGIQPGDVIVKMGDAKITKMQELEAVLEKHKANDKLTVVVRRGDKEVTLELTLGKRPE